MNDQIRFQVMVVVIFWLISLVPTILAVYLLKKSNAQEPHNRPFTRFPAILLLGTAFVLLCIGFSFNPYHVQPAVTCFANFLCLFMGHLLTIEGQKALKIPDDLPIETSNTPPLQ